MFSQYAGAVPLASFPENILSSPLACISWDYIISLIFKFIFVYFCSFLIFYFIKNCVCVIVYNNTVVCIG